ncbi:hypothetical protein AGRA3207_007023 [Actinomadura graeca]|uniref:Clp R domain-containing protein n=1 Tax=Actinomadura graeca TaxID=2750812 RepID=A0ABX8R387_9ACTN|nr:Clp protease N-terminal domain-containing protein [Actinomadura graeca]QXJ25517.1 hypothetical protein AGRA3207_007023 [Actinomadura graeca]
MFERFTDSARQAVKGAQGQARALGHHHIGPEHLLLALLEGDGPTGRELRRHGLETEDLKARLTRMSADPLDPDALRTIGIDLEAVRQATEETFGEGALDVPAGRSRPSPGGHVPFSPQAKKSLELGLRHALRLKQKHIAAGHVLLGVLHDDGSLAARLVTDAGADADALRAGVTRLLTSEAA